MPKAIVAYVPVLHRGYLQLFDKYPSADIYVLGRDVQKDYDYLRKDIRALEPSQVIKLLAGWGRRAHLATKDSLSKIGSETVVLPKDDLAKDLVSKYFKRKSIKLEPIFLRWDRENTVTNQDVEANEVVSATNYQNKIIKLLYEEADKASNWWRRVGAAIIKSGKIIAIAHNHNMPTPHTSYIDGDPRSTLHRGVGIAVTNDAHAEASMIAQAARDGLALKGTDIYVDTFPCPKCAKDIVNAGIKRCFFITGYAMTDAQSILQSGGVEIIRIKTRLKPRRGGDLVIYPKS